MQIYDDVYVLNACFPSVQARPNVDALIKRIVNRISGTIKETFVFCGGSTDESIRFDVFVNARARCY